MSTACRTRSVCLINRPIVIALSIMLAATIVSAGPQLWLYPKDIGPREGGYLVPPGSFTLVIENRGKSTEENNAQGVQLVVAVNDPFLIGDLSLVPADDGEPLELGDWMDGTPELPCSLKPMPRHSVYPASHATAMLGDLAGGERFEIDVNVEGGDELWVHFDAMATAWKTTGNGPKCSDVMNPSGHDVTVGQRPGGPDKCGRVRITKVGDQKYVDVGDTVVFTIDVLNEGSCDLTDPVLRDFIPAVEDGEGEPFPAFSVSGGTDPSPIQDDPLLVEWALNSPLPVGEQDGVVLEVIVEPVADGQRVVNRACISAKELHKPRCAAAVVIVGNPNGDEGPAGPGFWCHAAWSVLEDRDNAPVGVDDFEDWLFEIGESSAVFNDEYDASTLEAAQDLLCSPNAADGAADRLVRHLLTLWLNVVSGRLAMDQELDELCDGDELMPEDVEPSTVMELIVAVEDALVLGADDQTLVYWSEVVDAVNNSLLPGEPGCSEPLTTSGRQRAGHAKLRGKRAGDSFGH